MITVHATQSSFPRSGVGTHWRTLRRLDPRRWSGWTAFPRESVGTIKKRIQAESHAQQPAKYKRSKSA